jgi:acyl-CoA synthetase (AMP-forming)/AMP-acid ligase II
MITLKNEGCSFIYAIKAITPLSQSHIKIGLASNLMQRLSQIRSHSPLPLQMVYACRLQSFIETRKAEKEIHRILAHCCSHGEWFYVSPERAVATIRRALALCEYPERVVVKLPV